VILVTAANGNQGKLLIPRLLASGVAVRACVRSDESAQILCAAGVSDVVVGDVTEPDVLARATRGFEKVYCVGPKSHPKKGRLASPPLTPARAPAWKHVVFSSASLDYHCLVQHENKRDIEGHLISSGLEFTILQPATTCCATGSTRFRAGGVPSLVLARSLPVDGGFG